jgi:acetolactate synthase I/II/III large subunit
MLAGTSEMHFVAAMDTVPGMRPVLGLHETVCSGAADGYGRMARKPALTLLHLGPGLANSLANSHNAHRAGTPVVTLVGDMATWHKAADPLLDMDIPALAGTVSKTVLRIGAGDDPAAKMAEACAATKWADVAGGSRIATVIAPHDVSWERGGGGGGGGGGGATAASAGPRAVDNHPGGMQFIQECAAALRKCPRGKAAIYIGGSAAIADGERFD